MVTTAINQQIAPIIEPPTDPIIYHARVHDLPLDDRPRERLQKYGAETLSTPDLIAILLRTGTRQDNVMELATKLYQKYNGLSGLVSSDFYGLCTEHGLGAAKTCQLKAALELGKRLSIEHPDRRPQIKNADQAASFVRMQLMHLDHEEMHVLTLDTKNQVVENLRMYKGTVNSSVMRVAELLRPAVLRNCPHIILCHNHPSGDPTPSPEDIDITHQVIDASSLLDIELLDHIIIGNPRYFSIKEHIHW